MPVIELGTNSSGTPFGEFKLKIAGGAFFPRFSNVGDRFC
jgi:hypothetical protein